jgi:glycosyltransferase involved in cell wall biosynthesis
MRISIIGPAYPLRGGIAHHVYWLRQELTARGHTVQVISFRKLYPRIFFPGTTELDVSNIKLDAGALALLTPLNPISWRRTFKEVQAFSPDAVLFQWWQPFFGPTVGMLARWFRKSGIKCIIECHNVFPHEGSPVDVRLTRFALSAADHLITHSRKDRKDLLDLIPGMAVSVANLPRLKEFSGPAGQRRDGRTILFFGKVRAYKGLPLLLGAMPEVLAKVECKLMVVGEFYDPIEKYQKLISDLGIDSHIQIINRYVANEEVVPIFERADVLVLPYLSASQSGVARIALSNGLPVIASSVGGLSETIIDGVNGMLFTPGDSGALAARLVSYFTNNLGPGLSANILAEAADKKQHLERVIEQIAGASEPVTNSCSV